MRAWSADFIRPERLKNLAYLPITLRERLGQKLDTLRT
jgi:hypothetical protein